MQTLQIDKKKARKLYPTASNEFKEMLHDSFGKEFFFTSPIDRIKTWEDACEDQGLDPYQALPYKSPKDEHEEAVNGFAQMCIIAKSLNGDWKGDLSDEDQPKYYPWFERSGSALSYGGYVDWYADSNCGVRLSYRDRETAEYAGRQFLHIYNKFI
ncbi:MAG: hypothetical protein ACTHK8_02115 [Ginsengibacter sp.]